MVNRFALLLCALTIAGCAPSLPAAPNFTLTSDTGAPWTLSAQHGSEVALFFGYTHCTDTCPDTLAKLSAAMHAAGARARGEIAFVTIDPQRDTPAVLHKYIRRFSGATIVGLTGTLAQVAAVEKQYHVYANVKDDEHSAYTFLIAPNGGQSSVVDDDEKQSHIASLIRADIE